MAKKQNPKRLYKFSDGTLIQLSDTIRAFLNRDMADLSGYAVSAGTLTALQALRTAFSSTSTDVTQVALVKDLTATKDATRDAAESALRTLKTKVQGKVGISPAKVESLGIGAISKETDSDLYLTGENAVAQATVLIPELSGTGVDAPYLATITAAMEAYRAALQAMRQGEANRELATEDRIIKGNALYTEIVRLCEFGKDRYYGSNEAKYNDYIIYETEQEAGIYRQGNLADNAIANVNFESIEEEDNFRFTPDATRAYEVYFASTLNAAPAGGTTIISPGGGNVSFAATALGWTSLSPFLHVRNNATGGTLAWKVERLD